MHLIAILLSPRFIPAGAGNTPEEHQSFASLSVYPRWRGEHLLQISFWRILIGLSPLARGTPLGREFLALIIPVYPRWRGEHVLKSRIRDDHNGLSPLARGTLINPREYDGLSRFIPAGAGNTNYRSIIVIRGAVYPRWRGEHAYTLSNISPLLRFIPAGAGNTMARL